MSLKTLSVKQEQDRAKAQKLLVYYFRLCAKQSGIRWDPDNDAEICEIVDLILEAAHGSTGLPASIQEALNSGDGTYRP